MAKILAGHSDISILPAQSTQHIKQRQSNIMQFVRMILDNSYHCWESQWFWLLFFAYLKISQVNACAEWFFSLLLFEYIEISLSCALHLFHLKSICRSFDQRVKAFSFGLHGIYRIICKTYGMSLFCDTHTKPCQHNETHWSIESMRFAWPVSYTIISIADHTHRSRTFSTKSHFSNISLLFDSFHLARDLFSSSIVSVHNIQDHTYNNNNK